MLKFLNRQDGFTPVVALLVVLVVGVVGVAALRTSNAYFNRGSNYRRPGINRPTPNTNTSTNNTGSSANCDANGQSSTQVSGNGTATCTTTSPGSSGSTTNTCVVNGVSQPLVNGRCQASSQGASGAPGTSRCTINGQEVPCQ
jgi:Tfp pilus assembly protein PilV